MAQGSREDLFLQKLPNYKINLKIDWWLEGRRTLLNWETVPWQSFSAHAHSFGPQGQCQRHWHSLRFPSKNVSVSMGWRIDWSSILFWKQTWAILKLCRGASYPSLQPVFAWSSIPKDGSPLKVSENGRFPHLWRYRTDNDINDINDISMTSNLSMMSMTIINNFWPNMFKQHIPSTLTSTNHICEVLRLHPWPQWARCSPRSNGECHVLGNSYRWSWMWFLFFAIFSNLWKVIWERFSP